MSLHGERLESERLEREWELDSGQWAHTSKHPCETREEVSSLPLHVRR